MMFMRWTLAVGLALGVLSTMGQAEEWPQFRGPNNSGVFDTAKLPEEWSAEKNVAWKVQVPGYGWSSPIVWGDKVFVTTAITEKQKKPGGMGGPGGGPGGGFPPRGERPPRGGPGGFPQAKPPDATYRFEIHCLDRATGKTLWKEVAAEQKPTIAINPSNTYATETPVTDGERIYAYFGMTGIFCHDFAGKQVWKKDLGSYKMQMGHGTGASPALDGDRLFIQCDNEEESFLVALDKKTGKELWRTPRSEKSGYSTPLIWKTKKRTEVVCVGSPKVRSYDPETGKQLWELGGMTGQGKATPVATEDLLFVGTGGGFGMPGGGGRPGRGGEGGGGGAKPLFAVKAGASGDISFKAGEKSNDSVAWYMPQAGPATSSALVYKDYLYILEERGGILSCYDAKTGKQVYKERLQGARGFTSSPWALDGKIYCLDQDGTTFVVQAGEKFKQLGKNTVEEMVWSCPALAKDSMILRGVDNLYCIKTK